MICISIMSICFSHSGSGPHTEKFAFFFLKAYKRQSCHSKWLKKERLLTCMYVYLNNATAVLHATHRGVLNSGLQVSLNLLDPWQAQPCANLPLLMPTQGPPPLHSTRRDRWPRSHDLQTPVCSLLFDDAMGCSTAVQANWPKGRANHALHVCKDH